MMTKVIFQSCLCQVMLGGDFWILWDVLSQLKLDKALNADGSCCVFAY
jgi:hypothetical protein